METMWAVTHTHTHAHRRAQGRRAAYQGFVGGYLFLSCVLAEAGEFFGSPQGLSVVTRFRSVGGG